MGILMLVMLLVSMPGAMISGEGVIPIALFTAYLTALICGGVGGFVITSIMMIGSLFQRDGMKHLPLFWTLRSKSRIKGIMKRVGSELFL